MLCVLGLFGSSPTYATSTINKASPKPVEVYQQRPLRSSIYWQPILSLLLPGSGKFISGEIPEAFAYSSIAMGSLIWSGARNRDIDHFEASDTYQRLSDADKENIQTNKDIYRQRSLAGQLWLAAGGLSSYQSFQYTSLAYEDDRAFAFLKRQERPLEILSAPFEFSFLKRQTTWIPLSLISALAVLDANTARDDYVRDPITAQELAYSTAFSYNAGTFEEAIFRGWMMPVLMHSTNSLFWSNQIQAALFAAAHLNQISRPYVQYGLGLYFGWLTQKNQWSLREAIFVHSWWDVVAFLIQYQNRRQDDGAKLRAVSPAIFWLPRLSMRF